MLRIGPIAILLLMAGLFPAAAGVLQGELSYRERLALPADSIVEITLLDVTRADRPGELIASIQFRPKSQPPIPFAIHFADAEIDQQRSYAIRASILAGGRLVFVSAPTPRVLTQGYPQTVQIMLTLLSLSGLGISPTELIDRTWSAQEIKRGLVRTGVQSTIRINEAGDVTGSAGCNSLRGSAQFDGQSLAFSAIATTRRMCDPDTMRQETDFLHALELTRRFHIEGVYLELVGADGSEVVRLVRLP